MDAPAGHEDRNSTGGGARPSPVYDAALRGIFEGDLVGACRILGVPLADEPQALSTVFPLTTFSADLLVRVGRARLMHVEYARRASDDLVARMLIYRGLLMRAYPKHQVSQHIVVLGEGTVRGHDDLASNDFALSLHVLYLRDADSGRFLDSASFAPLAMLRRGDPSELAEVALRVIDKVQKHGGNRLEQLLEFTTVLAAINWDPGVVEKMITEVGMTVESIAEFYRNTRFSQLIEAEALERGREEGRETFLMAFLTERFGAHPELAEVAHRLAAWADPAAAVHAISAAATLDELTELLAV